MAQNQNERRVIMPNKSAKIRKRNKRLLNDKLSKQGRTSAQIKKYKLKMKRKAERKLSDDN